jgi:hypothetical protein
MSNPTYEICVDWDCTDWAGAHDFTAPTDDISNYVKGFTITRGAKPDDQIYPAATLELILENSSGVFYPTNSEGGYYEKIRLWLPIRVRATYSEVTYNLFYGYINRITCSPLLSKKEAYFYATDGIDQLAKAILIQDMDDKTTMTDGEAIHSILNAAGWKGTEIACTMQNAGDTITDAAHGLANGTMVMFSGASIAAGLDTHTLYYVISSAENTFQVSLTSGGAAVTLTGDGSGYYYVLLRRSVDNDGGEIASFPDTFAWEKPA